MKVRTNVKGGIRKAGGDPRHNQTIALGLRVKSNVKAGTGPTGSNHNQNIARGVRVKTNVKAGKIWTARN